MTSLALSFKDVNLTPLLHKEQIYFTTTQLAELLDYKNPKSISNLYNRNQDEFSDEMTEVIKSVTSGNLEKTVRIFNLRGSHLIAMFANTSVAKECRRWILDLIDKEIAKNSTALPEPTLTAEEQNMLQNAVKATHERTKLSYGEIWARTKNKFRVAEYKQIKCSDLRDALIYVASMQPDFLTQPKQTINVDWFNMMNFALLLKQYHRFTKDLPHIHAYLSAQPEHSAMAGLLKNHLTEMKNNDRLFTDSILSLSEISNHFLPQDQWKSLMRIFSEMIVE